MRVHQLLLGVAAAHGGAPAWAKWMERGDETAAVRPSTIVGAGLGAFALRSWRRHDVVGVCRCEVMCTESPAYDRRYSWVVNHTHGCNGMAFPNSNPMNYVNSVANQATCAKQNVEAKHGETHNLPAGTVQYVATKPIGIGDEILVDYGPMYWEPHTHPRSVLYECGVPPLHIAAARGDVDLAANLLSHGHRTGSSADSRSTTSNVRADEGIMVNATRRDPRLRSPGGGGWTALFEATVSGHRQMVQFLLRRGADVNHAPSGGSTALFWAAKNGLHAVLADLLDAGARPSGIATGREALGVREMSPLMAAAENGHELVVVRLLKARVGVRRKARPDYGLADGTTAMLLAAQHGHELVVAALLRAGGVDPDQRMLDGTTAVLLAAQGGHGALVSLLVQAGANVSLARRGGVTPVYVAARHGHDAVVEQLLAAGADLDRAQQDGATPLLVAAQHGHEEVVRRLLSSGADLSMLPLVVLTAERSGHEAIVDLFDEDWRANEL
jgi:ankyrin repeat protein